MVDTSPVAMSSPTSVASMESPVSPASSGSLISLSRPLPCLAMLKRKQPCAAARGSRQKTGIQSGFNGSSSCSSPGFGPSYCDSDDSDPEANPEVSTMDQTVNGVASSESKDPRPVEALAADANAVDTVSQLLLTNVYFNQLLLTGIKPIVAQMAATLRKEADRQLANEKEKWIKKSQSDEKRLANEKEKCQAAERA